MTRGTKQFLYGALFLFVFGVLGASVYFLFLKPAPGCFDGVKNQQEEGIDCGGPCEKDCLIDTLNPIRRAGIVRTFRIEENRSSLLLGIQNPNPTHAAKTFEYTVEIRDEHGTALTAFTAADFLYAGEFKYLLFPDVPFAASEIYAIEFSSRNPQWVANEKFPLPNLLVQRHETKEDGGMLRVAGVLVNQGTVRVRDVAVVALLYGRFGELAGASATKLDTLAAGETASFTILYPLIPGTNLQATKVFLSGRRP